MNAREVYQAAIVAESHARAALHDAGDAFAAAARAALVARLAWEAWRDAEDLATPKDKP